MKKPLTSKMYNSVAYPLKAPHWATPECFFGVPVSDLPRSLRVFVRGFGGGGGGGIRILIIK